MKTKSNDIKCDVQKIFGILSDNGFGTQKVFARISWNDREPKDEIRTIRTDSSGKQIVGKGTSLSESEFENLVKAMQIKRNFDEKSKPVNFDDIFTTASGIMDKRKDGFVTEDGYIILRTTGKTAELEKRFYERRKPPWD